MPDMPSWTWADYPAGGFVSQHARRRRRKPNGGLAHLPAAPSAGKPRDPLLVELVGSLTAGDCKQITETGALCASTLARWQRPDGTRCPRIDSLRRVIETLGKRIIIVE